MSGPGGPEKLLRCVMVVLTTRFSYWRASRIGAVDRLDLNYIVVLCIFGKVFTNNKQVVVLVLLKTVEL